MVSVASSPPGAERAREIGAGEVEVEPARDMVATYHDQNRLIHETDRRLHAADAADPRRRLRPMSAAFSAAMDSTRGTGPRQSLDRASPSTERETT